MANYGSTDVPLPPTLDELIDLLSKMDGVEATSFLQVDQIGVTLKFSKAKLGSVGIHAFNAPTQMVRELFQQLVMYKAYRLRDEMNESLFRAQGTTKTIEDAIAFLEQELKQDTSSLGTLYTKMRRDHFKDAISYLTELSRRREEGDRKAREERQRREQEEIKRKLDEEIRRREQEQRRREAEEAKAEAHRRWERQEEERRKRYGERTSDSGYARGSAEDRAWTEFFAAGGFGQYRSFFNDSEAFHRAFYEGMKGAYGGKQEEKPSSPPAKKKWYEILGCKAGATRDEIRRAFRKAAKGLHPDTNKNPADAERFKEISEAKAEGLDGLR